MNHSKCLVEEAILDRPQESDFPGSIRLLGLDDGMHETDWLTKFATTKKNLPGLGRVFKLPVGVR